MCPERTDREWLAALDDLRKWLDVSLQPAKCDENGREPE